MAPAATSTLGAAILLRARNGTLPARFLRLPDQRAVVPSERDRPPASTVCAALPRPPAPPNVSCSMSSESSQASAQDRPTSAGPSVAIRAAVAVFALLGFLFPYLASGGAEGTNAVGVPLLADGQALLTQHEVLSNIAEDGGLAGALTTSWWGTIDPGNSLYRPLSSFVLGVGAMVSGEPYNPSNVGAAALPFKLILLALKVVTALLVLELAFRLFKKVPHAAVAAFVFAALPVHASAVFDVAGTSIWLGTALTLGAWIAWLEAGDKPQSNPAALGLAALLLFAGTLAHELAFMLPFVLLATDIGGVREGGFGEGLKHSLGKLPGLLALTLALALSFGLRMAVVGGPLPELGSVHALGNPLVAEDFLTRFMNATRLGAQSIAVSAGINPLSADWSYSVDYSASQIPVLSAFAWQNLAGVGVLVALKLAAVALFGVCRTRAGLLLGLVAAYFWMSGALIPGGEMFSERMLVFPSVLLVLFIAPFLGALGKAGLGAAALVALASSFWNFSRAADWQSGEKLWKQTIESAPDSARAQYEYGLAIVEDRALLPLARARFQRALELYPGYASAQFVLGQAYQAEENNALAIEPYTKALELRLEQIAWTWNGERDTRLDGIPALLYFLTQERAFAGEASAVEHLAYLESVAERGFQSPDLWGRRGDTLRALGRFDEALEAYDTGIELGGVAGAYEIQAYKGRLLSRLGRTAEARAVYEDLAATDPEVLDDLGVGARADVLLALADLSLLDNPAETLASAEALIAGDDLTPFQTLRAHLLAAQARLTSGPESGDLQAVRAHENRIVESLQLGMLAAAQAAVEGNFSVLATPEAMQASELLAPFLVSKGDLTSAESLLREILNDRERPTLRARLADLYLRRSEFDAAADQAGLAAEGLVRDGLPVEGSIYLEARLLQLLALGSSDSEDARNKIDAVVAAERATGRSRNLAMVASWLAIDGDHASALLVLDELGATPDGGMQLEGVRSVIQQIQAIRAQVTAETLEGPELANAQAALAGLLLQLGDRVGALEAAQAAVDADPSADPVTQSNRLMILARATESARTPQAAIAVADRALALDIDDAMREAIQGYRQGLVWLTE